MSSSRIGAVIAICSLCISRAVAQAPAAALDTIGKNKLSPSAVASHSRTATPGGGATLMVPRGWSIERDEAKSLLLLGAPENDTRVVISDVRAANGRDAVAMTWAAYKPKAKWPIDLVTGHPADEGWDERQVIDYVTPANKRDVVRAFANRSGRVWTVVILDGSESTVEKRSAAIDYISDTLHPVGYRPESFVGRKAHALDKERIEELKEFVRVSMKELGVPGVAMALLGNGRVLYEGGFGVRALGKAAPVDANTLFIAASNTKGMTTLLLAELVDEGKLNWNEPVTAAYPGFSAGDPETTKRMLVKDLACQCSGVPREDFEWIFNAKNAAPDEVFKWIASEPRTSSFGKVFQYSNLLPAAAGYVGAHILYPAMDVGSAYDRAMQEKVFDPLGMKSTTFDFRRALSGNHATGYGYDIEGRQVEVKMGYDFSVAPVRPAAGVWTSAHDFIRYAQLEVNEGRLPNGRRLVSAKNLLMRRSAQVSLGQSGTYGLGLIVNRKYGIPVVGHGGSMAGFKSNFFVLPDSGVAAVILTNSNSGAELAEQFGRRLLEVLFDGKLEAAANVAIAAENEKARQVRKRQLLTVPADARAAAQLARTYYNAKLGRLAVIRTDSRTTFDFGEWASEMASRKDDDGTVSFVTIDPTDEVFTFVAGRGSGERTLTLRDAQHQYVYTEGE